MQAGSYFKSDVQAVVSRVLVNGVERDHSSWSVDRELSGDLPAQVAAVSGVMQATGSVVWAEVSTVTEKPTNPWNSGSGWVPKRGDRVEIYAGDEDTEWKQFTGLIDKTTGSVGGGFQSTLIDDYDNLSVPVTHEPLTNIMPPSTPGGEFRGVGLVHTFYVDLAMRRGGFFATPSREANPVVYVPGQGGVWPHFGRLSTSDTPSGASCPSNNFAPWGFAVGDFRSIYTVPSPKNMSAPVQLSFMVAPSHDGTYYTHVNYGSSYVRLSIDSAWLVSAVVNSVTIASFTLSGKGGADGRVVELLVKDSVFTLRSSNGQSASAYSTFTGSTLMASVRLDGDVDSRVAGMQVSHPDVSSQEFASVNFVPSARISTANTSFMGVPKVIPAIDGVPAHDLLQEIGDASLSAAWIDELGVLQWWPALAIRAKNVYQTMTTLDDVFDMDWEDSILGSRSSVTVKYQDPALRISKLQNIELAVGSGETLGSGDVSENFFAPEADVVWIMPDYVQANTGPGKWGLYNAKNGTLAGMYFTQDGDEIATEYSVSINNEKLGVTGAMKMTHTAGTFPAGVEAQLSTSPADPVLKVQNRDKPLPRVAGHALAEYMDREYVSTAPGGIGTALVHETGKWIPSNIVSNIADFLASETAVPKPVITGLNVVFDPRRQLCDVAEIRSDKLLGVTLRVLVVGVSNSFDSSGATQSLSVRVIEVVNNSMTYAQYNNLLTQSTLTYAQWQALGPIPQTYGQFNDSL